jgi:hypothetical protein
MTKAVFIHGSVLALVTAILPAMGAAQAANQTAIPHSVASAPRGGEDDCETRIQKLEDSNAEGEERLAAKNEVIDFCARQYERDNTIKALVKACAKYEEQPVVKQQFVAECQLAAFTYANALRTLKMEYGK